MSPTRAGTHFSALVLTHSECRFTNLDFRHLATVRDTDRRCSISIHPRPSSYPSTVSFHPSPIWACLGRKLGGVVPPGQRISGLVFSPVSYTLLSSLLVKGCCPDATPRPHAFPRSEANPAHTRPHLSELLCGVVVRVR